MGNIIFVYGTLKRHFHNHHYLDSAELIGCGRTKSKFALYVERIPYVFKDDPVSHIWGEIYRVDNMTLEKLDRLEGHPQWYQRQEVTIVLFDEIEKEDITGWMYFFPEKRGKLIVSGLYDE